MQCFEPYYVMLNLRRRIGDSLEKIDEVVAGLNAEA
jgi:hypothetical protein